MHRLVHASNPCRLDLHKYEEAFPGSGSPFFVLYRCKNCGDEIFNYDPDECDCPGGPRMVDTNGRCCSCDKKEPGGGWY